MNSKIYDELSLCADKLEKNFNDMVDFEFCVEKGELFIVSSRIGKRTPRANLKIILSMFCEGKLTAEDVIKKIPYKDIEKILNEFTLTNIGELKFLAKGVNVSCFCGTGFICDSEEKARMMIVAKKDYIFFQEDMSNDSIDLVSSKFCMGVVSCRGGLTSHSAVMCRGLNKPCVIINKKLFFKITKIYDLNNEITVDGYVGKIYIGHGNIECNKNLEIEELKLLSKLLPILVKNNIILSNATALLWRLWNVLILCKSYHKEGSLKQIVNKKDEDYVSFIQPSKKEVENLYSKLYYINNLDILVEDFINFLIEELSSQVSVGQHYLYFKPIIDPMKTLKNCVGNKHKQLTGIEFFNINKYVDFLINIYSIKIYFSTEIEDDFEFNIGENCGLNYLDFTNLNGESIVINNYRVKGAIIYINDVFVPMDKLMSVYHLIRRRKYYWTWFNDNNITKSELVNYLNSNILYEEDSKLYYLCEEMNLIKDKKLTKTGRVLLGENIMEKSNNIDYILDEVLLRGYDVKQNNCNDFSKLILRKEFKDLIALELYEYYFWEERHEFDLQLLKELVESVCAYFNNPTTLSLIETGLLQTLPSVIIVAIVSKIWKKIKEIKQKKKQECNENSSWARIEKNIKKIDDEFSKRDYILSDEIENIFGVSRDEIQSLLKLCGCKCYIDKKRSIWIKVGTNEKHIREILKNNNFKYKFK